MLHCVTTCHSCVCCVSTRQLCEHFSNHPPTRSRRTQHAPSATSSSTTATGRLSFPAAACSVWSPSVLHLVGRMRCPGVCDEAFVRHARLSTRASTAQHIRSNRLGLGVPDTARNSLPGTVLATVCAQAGCVQGVRAGGGRGSRRRRVRASVPRAQELSNMFQFQFQFQFLRHSSGSRWRHTDEHAQPTGYHCAVHLSRGTQTHARLPPGRGTHMGGGSPPRPHRDGLLHPGSRLDASSPSNHSDKSASPSSLQTRWQRHYARTYTGMAHARAPPDERPGKPFAVTFSLHGIFSGPRTVGTVAVMINIRVSFTTARFLVVVVTIRT